MKQWIVVASRVRARVFSKLRQRSHLEEVAVILNPDGRLRDRELQTDRPGMGRSKFSAVSAPHSYTDNRTDPHEKSLIAFCKNLAFYIHQHSVVNDFGSITVFAESHMLGLLKSELSKFKMQIEPTWIDKDLDHDNIHNLELRLKAA